MRMFQFLHKRKYRYFSVIFLDSNVPIPISQVRAIGLRAASADRVSDHVITQMLIFPRRQRIDKKSSRNNHGTRPHCSLAVKNNKDSCSCNTNNDDDDDVNDDDNDDDDVAASLSANFREKARRFGAVSRRQYFSFLFCGGKIYF